jgi:sec-independent protein translocase protein TatB
MFDIDFEKILVFGVIALVVIPAKDLPRVLRTVGQTLGKMRRMANEFRSQFMDAINEADLEQVKKEISSINDLAKVDTSMSTPAEVKREAAAPPSEPKPAEPAAGSIMPPPAEHADTSAAAPDREPSLKAGPGA